MTVSLGPFDKTVPNLPNNPRADGYGHNPRCLKRDVNKYAAAVTTANYSYALITQYPDINDFQNVLLGTPAKNDWGVHIGGHYTIGGDPGGVSCFNPYSLRASSDTFNTRTSFPPLEILSSIPTME